VVIRIDYNFLFRSADWFGLQHNFLRRSFFYLFNHIKHSSWVASWLEFDSVCPCIIRHSLNIQRYVLLRIILFISWPLFECKWHWLFCNKLSLRRLWNSLNFLRDCLSRRRSCLGSRVLLLIRLLVLRLEHKVISKHHLVAISWLFFFGFYRAFLVFVFLDLNCLSRARLREKWRFAFRHFNSASFFRTVSKVLIWLCCFVTRMLWIIG
jgi:hypothetical protein